MERGYCLVAQQLRRKIQRGEIRIFGGDLSLDSRGWFKNGDLETRVQPSSFEPLIGDQGFLLDVEQQSAFCPKPDQTVRKAILELPSSQRKRIDINGGYELKTGHCYALPLEESVVLNPRERMKASPKSSIGRVFPVTRMISDFNPLFDEIHFQYTGDRRVRMWLLIQPTVFNLIVYPGLTLNQLRFFNGFNATLTQQEIYKENRKNPFLHIRRRNQRLYPLSPVVTEDGMHIGLDLAGEFTSRVVALRVRKNPNPIDLSKTNYYDAEDFFEPVENKNGQTRFRGNNERYLFSSRGILRVPPHLSAELARYSGIGVIGSWDWAGFVDNDWYGNLVFEAAFNEVGGVTLSEKDERPVSTLKFFRSSEIPNKLYGPSIGSHYKGQEDLRVSKHFKPFDFARAAKEYGKLNRDVLLCDNEFLKSMRLTREGFEPVSLSKGKNLIRKIEREGFFHSRYDCEDDEEVLQIIPYVVLFNEYGEVFTYVRASDIEKYGERKLFGKHSFGLGGHIVRKDQPDFVQTCVARELSEEARISGSATVPRLAGTLIAYDKAVDRVHFGLVHIVHFTGKVRPNESSIASYRMRSIEDIGRGPELYETWSKILIPYLPLLGKR